MAQYPVNILALAKRTYLKPAQRDSLRRSIRQQESMLHLAQSPDLSAALPGGTAVDVDVLRQNLSRDQEALDRGTPPELSQTQQRKLFAALRQLKEEFTHGMPSVEQMERPTAQNIDAYMHWSAEHKNRVLAYKTIVRMLQPDNDEPNLTNIERYRPTQPSYVSFEDYWKNFPDFEQDIQDEMATVDATTVHEVALYYTAGWAEANILRKLAITKDQYRLALQQIKRRAENLEDLDDPLTFAPLDTTENAPDAIWEAMERAPVVEEMRIAEQAKREQEESERKAKEREALQQAREQERERVEQRVEREKERKAKEKAERTAVRRAKRLPYIQDIQQKTYDALYASRRAMLPSELADAMGIPFRGVNLSLINLKKQGRVTQLDDKRYRAQDAPGGDMPAPSLPDVVSPSSSDDAVHGDDETL